MKYIRLIAGPLSAFSIVALASLFWWLRIQEMGGLLAIAWMIGWFSAEAIWVLGIASTTPRLLTHLRWGPLVILLVALTIIVAYDQLLILRSKQDIKDYVYNSLTIDDVPEDLRLHTNYRGWCGNGLGEAMSRTYLETAMEGFESKDPSVRLRSLKMSRRLSGFSEAPQFQSLMRKALTDSDSSVREYACDYFASTR